MNLTGGNETVDAHGFADGERPRVVGHPRTGCLTRRVATMSTDDPGYDKSPGRFNEQTANECDDATDADGYPYADTLAAGKIDGPTDLRMEHDNGDVEEASIFPGPDAVTFTIGEGLQQLVRSVPREWWDRQADECETEAERIDKAIRKALGGDD